MSAPKTTPKATLGILAALVAAACACTGSMMADNPLLGGVEQPSAPVQRGCNIAQDKCTRCHTIERLLVANVSEPSGWQLYVQRMRLMPGARIQDSDAPQIVRCLVYRSFGNKGLATLKDLKN